MSKPEQPTTPGAEMGGVKPEVKEGEKRPENLKELFEKILETSVKEIEEIWSRRKHFEEQLKTAIGEEEVQRNRIFLDSTKETQMIIEQRCVLLEKIRKFFPNDDELKKEANLPPFELILRVMLEIIQDEVLENPKGKQGVYKATTIITLVNFLRLSMK